MDQSGAWNRNKHVWRSKCIKAEVIRKLEVPMISDLPDNERLQLACGSFANTINHSRAITLLIDTGYDGSALALARPCFEAFVRASWLMHCSTDDEIRQIGKVGRNSFPHLKLMLSAIGTKRTSMGMLGRIKESVWGLWCSYTHGDWEQILGQLSPGRLEQNYPPETVELVLMSGDFWHLLSAMELATITANIPLRNHFLARFKSYSDSFAPS